MEPDELGQCIRAWRNRLSPAAVGLPKQRLRRAPGLRREELAQLAGVSVDYLTRLEQGRAVNPSAQVLGSLGRALRLTTEEEAHLFRVAGEMPPSTGRINRHMTAGVQRVLDRLDDVPVVVLDAAWSIVAWNRLAAALIGDPSEHTGRARNIVWRYFAGEPSRMVRDPEEDAAFEAEAAADLHAALGRYPDDPELESLIADLRRASPRFEQLWQTRPVATRRESRKTVDHPEIGRITLDCDVLQAQGSDLRLIVYTAEPGTPDADALALLGAIGLQQLR
ncbi:MAG: helix-turn-helix transcriptional regulator [Thermoleophilaceae bacterium]